MSRGMLRKARAYLVDTHMLSPAEADAALAVAGQVLRAGLSRLLSAVAAGDGRACAEAAHGLKGNLLNLGLPNLARAAQAIYAAAEAGDPAGCLARAKALSQALVPLLGPHPDA